MKALVLVLVLALSACAPKAPLKPSTLGRYNFAYELKDQAAAGVIQVFDDGRLTYFQFAPGFRELVTKITKDSEAKPLKTELFGRSYLSVSGPQTLIRHWLVHYPFKTAMLVASAYSICAIHL